jgi:hypothetical protein
MATACHRYSSITATCGSATVRACEQFTSYTVKVWIRGRSGERAMNCLIARVAQYGADLAGRRECPYASSGCWRSIQARAICQTAFEGLGQHDPGEQGRATAARTKLSQTRLRTAPERSRVHPVAFARLRMTVSDHLAHARARGANRVAQSQQILWILWVHLLTGRFFPSPCSPLSIRSSRASPLCAPPPRLPLPPQNRPIRHS